jgi:hypothetical protein
MGRFRAARRNVPSCNIVFEIFSQNALLQTVISNFGLHMGTIWGQLPPDFPLDCPFPKEYFWGIKLHPLRINPAS